MDEDDEGQQTQRRLSHATLPPEFRRALEKRLTLPRTRSRTSFPKLQMRQSLVGAVNTQESKQSLVERRSSDESNYSLKGKQKPIAPFQAEALANTSWQSGESEGNHSVSRSMSPSLAVSIATPGGTSPVPTPQPGDSPAFLGYVRPLPSIPGTNSFVGRRSWRHSRSQSASPVPGSYSRPTNHQTSVSASGHTFSSSAQANTLYGPPRSITPSNTHLMLRGSGAIAPPDPDAPHYDTKHNPHHNTKNDTAVPLAKREFHEMKTLIPRTQQATSINDPHAWMETSLPEIIAYSRAPRREIVDRMGEVKSSNYGGVEF